MIGETVGHYRITAKLGGGGMGIVYRAEDIKLKRTVALKFLSPELTTDERAKQRFLNEAQAASQLDHPNICTIHEIGETDDGQLFLVLSCYDGETVRDRLEKGPLPVDEAVGLALHVARGLAKAHEKGIVHRDIKPANIFLTNDGRAKILDFGLAKLAGQTRLTRAGGTMGTVAYMSPEQARGADLGPGTDLWSLGVVLFEALSGQTPFPGERAESVLYSVVHEEPKELTELRHDVPAPLASIVSKCLRKDPAGRFQSASELAAALEPLRGNHSNGSSIIEIGSTTRIPAVPTRRRGLTVAVVALLVCAGLFAVPPVRDAVRGWLGWGEPTELRLLAVLPFRNAGASSDDAFVDGLRRSLTSRLSQFERDDETFRVIPASELDEQNVTTPERALAVSGATLALEGEVERRGGGVTLWLTLVDVSSGERSPSRPWEGNLTNVAECQEGPVVMTAGMLGLAAEGPGRQALSAGGTTVPGAWELYLSGIGRLWAEDDSTDHIEDAVSLLNEALALDPSYAQAFVGLGQAYWSLFVATVDEENAWRAAESARAAIELDDGLSDAHIVAGLVEKRVGSDSLAIQEFTRALEIDPVSFGALRGLASVGYKSDDLALAESTFKRAVDARPKHWRAHYDLGAFYYRRDKFDDALTALETATDLAPENASPYIVIGAVHYSTDRYDDAKVTWERALALAPPRAMLRMVYSNLGTCYFVLAMYGDAIESYEIALDMDDSYYGTWGNLAAAYDVVQGEEERAMANYATARDLAEEQLKLTPGDEGVLASLALYSAELGDTASAWDYLNRSMELNPDDAQGMFFIGLAHENLDEREVAIDWIVRAVENGYSRVQVESTPGLRGLCSDGDYLRQVRDGSESR